MIEINFKENQLGSYYLKQDLIADLNVKYKDITTAHAQANTIGIGQSFHDDQRDLQVGPLAYSCLGLEDSTPLSQRNFAKPTLLHIDLRIIDPSHASAIETHPINTHDQDFKEKSNNYLSWEELMISILKLRENSQIKAFHLSGYCPDRDRRLQLNYKIVPLNFHLTCSQETHQFTLALLHNCIEVLSL